MNFSLASSSVVFYKIQGRCYPYDYVVRQDCGAEHGRKSVNPDEQHPFAIAYDQPDWNPSSISRARLINATNEEAR